MYKIEDAIAIWNNGDKVFSSKLKQRLPLNCGTPISAHKSDMQYEAKVKLWSKR